MKLKTTCMMFVEERNKEWEGLYYSTTFLINFLNLSDANICDYLYRFKWKLPVTHQLQSPGSFHTLSSSLWLRYTAPWVGFFDWLPKREPKISHWKSIVLCPKNSQMSNVLIYFCLKNDNFVNGYGFPQINVFSELSCTYKICYCQSLLFHRRQVCIHLAHSLAKKDFCYLFNTHPNYP